MASAPNIESIVTKLESGDSKEIEYYVKLFNKTYCEKFSFVDFEKNNVRDRLWIILYQCLSKPQPPAMYESCLLSVRILSRDKVLTDQSKIVNEQFVNVLLYHAGLKEQPCGKSFNSNVAIESLKCLSNIIYNSPKVQLICSRNATMDGIIRRIRTYPESDIPHLLKFFDMKILFLVSTLVPDINFRLKNELHALTYLTEALDFILKQSADNVFENQYGFPTLSMDSVNLSCEILKVLFNITAHEQLFNPDEDEESCLRLITILRELLLCSTPPDVYDTLCSNVVNLLMNMPATCLELLAPQESLEYNTEAMSTLLSFLYRKLSNVPQASMFEAVSPTLTFLIKITRNHKVLRRFVRKQILPPLKSANIKLRPEQEDSLRGKLVQLLVSNNTQLRDLVAELLFILCRGNVNRVVKYTGYGNVAGALAQKGLLAGGTATTVYSSDSEDDSDTEDYTNLKDQINPVTGSFEPPKLPGPSTYMTEDQQEYEAMKLVNMMDKLCKEGLVQPARIGEDGKPHPVEHILQLQEEIPKQNKHK